MEMNFDWTKIIQGIFSGGSIATIIKGIMLLVVGVGTFFLRGWLKDKKREAAQAQTQTQRQDHQTQIDQETRVISQDAQNSERRVEDIINGE